jgi:hypothetical protein
VKREKEMAGVHAQVELVKWDGGYPSSIAGANVMVS